MQAQQVYVEAQVAYMRLQIQASCFDQWQKEELLSRFNLLQLQHVVALCNTASSPISVTNMRYMEDKIAKEDKVFDDPKLMRTPIVRNGKQATVGYCPEIWATWE